METFDLQDRTGYQLSIALDLCEYPVLDQKLVNSFLVLQKRISALKVNEADGWPMGLEKTLVLNKVGHLEDLEGFSLTRIIPRVKFEPRNINSYFYERPDSELAAFYAWKRVERRALNRSDIKSLNRLLGGNGYIRCTKKALTRFPSGHAVVFCDAKNTKAYLSEWLFNFNKPFSADQILIRATWLLLNFLIIHPFHDVNGRTSRLLWQLFLRDRLGLRFPLLPLAPYFSVNQETVLVALLDWEVGQRPRLFFELMHRFIKDMLDRIEGA